MLTALALTACTGATDGNRVRRPAPASHLDDEAGDGPSLEFAVAVEPIDCQDPSSATAACVLGGSAVTGRFGKLRICHEVRLGSPSRDGCAPATLDGSVSGGGWSLPLTGDRSVPSHGCGHRPPLRAGSSGTSSWRPTRCWRRGDPADLPGAPADRLPAGHGRPGAAVLPWLRR